MGELSCLPYTAANEEENINYIKNDKRIDLSRSWRICQNLQYYLTSCPPVLLSGINGDKA